MSPLENIKVRLLFSISLLVIILVISAPVVNSVLVNLINSTETVPLSSATVFVDPDVIVKDYELDPGYQIGDYFTVHVNISGVSNLFTWQLNMSWDPSILNVSSSTGGEFLARSDNDTSSEVLGMVINATDNVEGYTGMAESILANVSGITGSGRLVSIEFLIVGYGHTNLTSNDGGTLSTMLLDSAGVTIGYGTQDGYFRNTITGDIQGDAASTPPDGDCDRWDFLQGFLAAYGSSEGQPNYNILADLQGDAAGTPPDGDVDRWDFLQAFLSNYGRSIVLP